MQTAIVIGATGLVGGHLISLLEQTPQYQSIVAISRSRPKAMGAKTTWIATDFEDLEILEEHVKGNVLFSALGTTLKKAGSKDAQYKVDYNYQWRVAAVAAKNKVPRYVLVSSIGAHANSRIFYSRMKGKLEQAIQQLDFDTISVMRPSVLAGKRQENRLGERIGLAVSQLLQVVPGLRKYRAIHGRTVAKAMIVATAKQQNPHEIYESDALFTLANQYSKEDTPVAEPA